MSSQLCFVQSLYLYGKSTGEEQGDFTSFYKREMSRGNVGMGSKGPYYVYNPQEVMNRYGIQQRTDIPAARKDLNASGAKVALVQIDTRGDGKPNHFMMIVKKEGGWVNMDHTSTSELRRNGKTRWSRVHRIMYIQGVN